MFMLINLDINEAAKNLNWGNDERWNVKPNRVKRYRYFVVWSHTINLNWIMRINFDRNSNWYRALEIEHTLTYFYMKFKFRFSMNY